MARSTRWIVLMVLVVAMVGAFAVRASWMPGVRARLLTWLGAAPAQVDGKPADEHGHDDHAGHDHAGHNEMNSIELSKQAQANVGLKLGKVALSTFDRTISIPGILRERPGRSTVAITTPLTGIVTRIYVIQGEAVEAGRKLFDLQLTHEELVQGQGDFLRTTEELDVLEREIARLEKIAAEGGIAGKQVLERQYERQTKQAVLRAQHQGLLLHGLTEDQVKSITEKRELLRSLTVAVPAGDPTSTTDAVSTKPRLYEIQELRVVQGQSVNAGETLAVLADYEDLYIEGNAFDKDIAAVNAVVEKSRPVQAVIETEGGKPDVLKDLKILYVGGKVDAESRTFQFYVPLFNEQLRDLKTPDGRRFIGWKYKPGQRVQVLLPVEQWADRIVLPADAVAQDGAETYVFVPNGDHFDRMPVHVEYRDRLNVVVANDGSLFPGDAVVLAGAQQMQLALKNKAGGGIDPHAGHNH